MVYIVMAEQALQFVRQRAAERVARHRFGSSTHVPEPLLVSSHQRGETVTWRFLIGDEPWEVNSRGTVVSPVALVSFELRADGEVGNLGLQLFCVKGPIPGTNRFRAEVVSPLGHRTKLEPYLGPDTIPERFGPDVKDWFVQAHEALTRTQVELVKI